MSTSIDLHSDMVWWRQTMYVRDLGAQRETAGHGVSSISSKSILFFPTISLFLPLFLLLLSLPFPFFSSWSEPESPVDGTVDPPWTRHPGTITNHPGHHSPPSLRTEAPEQREIFEI